jgi:hypothetical protein
MTLPFSSTTRCKTNHVRKNSIIKSLTEIDLRITLSSIECCAKMGKDVVQNERWKKWYAYGHTRASEVMEIHWREVGGGKWRGVG